MGSGSGSGSKSESESKSRLRSGQGPGLRFLSALTNDIRYQIKYGFYFLYAFISAIYIAILFITPVSYKTTVASIIILTDPAMLGMFFIGGIWLLEKEEGLHRFWCVSPLREWEYIAAKAVSLALISTASAGLIVRLGLGKSVHYLPLLAGVFIGACIFTTLGLVVASYARSVNNYIVIGSPVAVILSTPPILYAFGIFCPSFTLLPGTALWRIICFSIKLTDCMGTEMGIGLRFGIQVWLLWLWILLVLWLGIAVLLANARIPTAIRKDEDKST